MPLVYIPIGLMVGFTSIFPILAFVTLPIAAFIVFSIFSGDISLVTKATPTTADKNTEEE
ncbi:MAG: hypothetical protein HN689_07730 [Euryarchaeota archaeon]|nr:hypothetical protein [Euryarchaeota archaeon]